MRHADDAAASARRLLARRRPVAHTHCWDIRWREGRYRVAGGPLVFAVLNSFSEARRPGLRSTAARRCPQARSSPAERAMCVAACRAGGGGEVRAVVRCASAPGRPNSSHSSVAYLRQQLVALLQTIHGTTFARCAPTTTLPSPSVQPTMTTVAVP